MTTETDPAPTPTATPGPFRGPPPGESWPPWAAQLFAALAFKGTIVRAAKEIGKHRSTIYEWFEKAPSLRAECLRARNRSDAARERALQLAIEGTEEPVLFRGQIACKKRRFYPSLLKAVLDERRPEHRRKGKLPVADNAREIAEATCDLLATMQKTIPTESESVGRSDSSGEAAA